MRETASKSGLLLSPCLRWAHPAARWYEDRAEDASKREDGKAIHKAIQLHDHGLPSNIPSELIKKATHAFNYLDTLKGRCQWLRTEVVLGINWATGEAVLPETKGDRDYPDDDRFFYGTADVLALLVGGSLLVADWKSGGGAGVDAQLLSLSCPAVRLFPQGGLRIAALYITDDGVISTEREVPVAELTGHYDAMAHAVTSARATAKPRLPVVGAHCTELYCPHLAYCPSTQKDAEVMAGPEEERLRGLAGSEMAWTGDVLDVYSAGWKASRIGAIKRAVKYHEGKVKDWVNAGNKAVWDGYIYEDRGAGFRRYKVN